MGMVRITALTDMITGTDTEAGIRVKKGLGSSGRLARTNIKSNNT
jgi:hypothetical protein